MEEIGNHEIDIITWTIVERRTLRTQEGLTREA
jgi:hypothetical protein